MNESYHAASFHYWKSKFGFTGRGEVTGNETNNHTEDFAPVRFPVAPRLTVPSAEVETKETDAIMIELPEGVKIHFRGSYGTKAAMGIISQMYSSHVLPE